VVDYMEAEAPEEAVEHAEKIAAERVFGNEYFVWDVHTDKARWWVVDPPTNLHSQQDFKSMDGVLSFHIGLMARVMAHDAAKAPSRPEPRLEKTRRQWEQAAEAQVEADEAEDFQAVGVRCRETLVSFVHAMGSPDLVPEGEPPPKASDFVLWGEHIANAVASGSSAAELRGYLKSLAKETWGYVQWLTHAKNAARADGAMAVEMVAHLLSLFEQAIERKARGGPGRCPACHSYRVVGDEPYDLDGGTLTHATAMRGVRLERGIPPGAARTSAPTAPTLEGECLPSSPL
jgi:hypothetical protein